MNNKYYDEVAKDYEGFSNRRLNYINKINNLIIEHLNNNNDNNSKLLDVGAGDGSRGFNLSKKLNIDNITMIEPSKELFKLCEKIDGITNIYNISCENISKKIVGDNFNIVICLWNVLGHVGNTELRIKSLQNISNVLSDDGRIFLDVNNRHNSNSYGVLEVLKRKIIDGFNFKEERGDAFFTIKYNNQEFQMSGHLFIPKEMLNLIEKTNLEIEKVVSVDYNSGKVDNNLSKGQLFYVIKKRVK